MRLVVRSVVGVMASGTVANTRRGLRSVRTLPTPLRALQRTVLLLLRMKIGNNVVWQVNEDGSILGRKPFRDGGTIGMQRLQFSSNLGIACCISAERVPQMIEYEI